MLPMTSNCSTHWVRPPGRAARVGTDRSAAVSVCGRVPKVGDTVLLGPPAGAQFQSPEFPAWFRVIAVDAGMTAGFVYLTGWTAADLAAGAVPRREFCRVAGLVLRDEPFQLPDDRGCPGPVASGS